MGQIRAIAGIWFIALAFITSCAVKESLPSQPPGQKADQLKIKTEQQAVQKDSWEAQWERTLQAARKEGKVVIMATNIGLSYKEASPIFKNKFEKNIELVAKRGGEIMTSLLAERRAGIYAADILISGTNTFFGQAKPAKVADPLDPALMLPEILDRSKWYDGELYWVDTEHMSINLFAYPSAPLAINTDIVKPQDVKSYYDILNPKWKGKILMNDPTISGVGLKSFSVAAFAILNLDYFRQLAKQDPVIIRDQRLQANWLAQRKYPVLVFPSPSNMLEFQQAGAPLAYISPQEGTHLSRDGGAMSLLNNAPHPSAARVLINWSLSREGLAHISRIQDLQTARVDVPTDFLDPVRIRQPGAKYFLGADSEQWIARDPEYKKAAEEVLGHLMK